MKQNKILDLSLSFASDKNLKSIKGFKLFKRAIVRVNTCCRPLEEILNNSMRETVERARIEYVNFLIKTFPNKGLTHTIKLAKSLFNSYKRYTLQVHPQEYEATWYKRNKSGLPKCLPGMNDLIKDHSKPDLQRVALSILASHYTFIDNESRDVNTIISPSPQIPIDFLISFSMYTKVEVLRRRLKVRGRNFMGEEYFDSLTPKDHFSHKGGPNGQALESSHLDACYITSHANAFECTLRYMILTCDTAYDRIVALAEWTRRICSEKKSKWRKVYERLIPSKLAFLRDRAGKTRIVGIGDYWTQRALKPLHDKIMSYLRNLETDGTFQQDSIAARVKLWTKQQREIYCYDLTAATDRWPIQTQKIVLSQIFSEDFAEKWSKIVSDRDFHYGKQKVRYSVGQPMGFYSSWPVFALTHHFVVWYSAWRSGIKNFTDYVILGDDIAIANPTVAEEYFRIITEVLGMNISKAKSILPETNSNSTSAEIAKRFFKDGLELTPLTPDILIGARSTYFWLVNDIIRHLVERWEWIDGNGLRTTHRNPRWAEKIIGCLQKRHQKSALVFLTSPLGQLSSKLKRYNWVSLQDPWANINELMLLEARGQLLVRKLENAFELLEKLKKLIKDNLKGGPPTQPTHLLLMSIHPIGARLRILDEFLTNLYRKYSSGTLMDTSEVYDLSINVDWMIWFIKKQKSYRTFLSERQGRLKYLCNLSNEWLKACENPDESDLW